MADERMSWEEICSKYPEQQVLLSDVEWTTGHSVSSAIVVSTDKDHTKTELNGMAMMSRGRYYSTNTAQPSLFCVGVAMVTNV